MDAQLFKKVYKSMALLSDVEEETVLNLRIYPLVGDMILGNSALKNKTTELLKAHCGPTGGVQVGITWTRHYARHCTHGCA